MSLYLNFRSQHVGGSVVEPTLLEGDGTANPPDLRLVDDLAIAARVAAKRVLFGVHGFNVSFEHGARSLGQLDAELARDGLSPTTDLFIGVLWPGDSWLPVVNYPFEGGDAMACGRRLAAFCQKYLGSVQSISFASHSLGVRVVLEAVKYLAEPARIVCLTAPAINRDALTAEYSSARANAASVSVLASRRDWVLKVAFPVGDPLADLLDENHSPFQPALGYGGPPVPAAPPIVPPWQIADGDAIGHLDYMPPGDAVQDAAARAHSKWPRPAGFIARAFRGQPQTWP